MGVEVHEQTIEAPPADVWGFMVDPAALSAWFGADAWLEPAVGGSVLFRFADGSVRRGVVEQVERCHILAWRWRKHRGAGFGMELGESSRADDPARTGRGWHARPHHRVVATATAPPSRPIPTPSSRRWPTRRGAP